MWLGTEVSRERKIVRNRWDFIDHCPIVPLNFAEPGMQAQVLYTMTVSCLTDMFETSKVSGLPLP